MISHLPLEHIGPDYARLNGYDNESDRIDRIRFGSSRMIRCHIRVSRRTPPRSGRGRRPLPDTHPPERQQTSSSQKPENSESRNQNDRDTTTRKPMTVPKVSRIRTCHGRRSGRTSASSPPGTATHHTRHPRPSGDIRAHPPPDTDRVLIQAARPLPHVAGHVQRAARAGAGRVLPNRCRVADVIAEITQFLRRWLIAPRIDPAIASACGFLPLGFGGEPEWPCRTPGSTTGRRQPHLPRRH